MTEPFYDLFGQTPGLVAAPETIEEALQLVRESVGKAIVPWGGGTHRHLGYPPACYDLALSTANFNQITEYSPADLIVTAQAGVTLTQLQEALAVQGQTLPIDAALPDKQTVGGIVAARAGSLRRLSCGSVRDSLLGVSVINCRAELVKGGGKVVKNVAGYDLPKLYCGSFGTLGLIVEATFKVAPLPETSATVALPLDPDHNSEDVLDHLLGSELVPSFLFLLNPAAAEAVLPEVQPAQYIIVGFDGPVEAVTWQVETLGAAPLAEEEAAQVRARLRDFTLNEAPMTASFHILSSQVGAFTRMVEWTARRAGFSAQVSADAALGLMTAHFSPVREAADWSVFYTDLKDKADRCGGSFILERMPEVLRGLDVPVWSPLLPDFGLMARLKKTLDPDRLWNPGRFVGKL
jgi:glycolate oxidase FAD binding subunit